MYNAYEGCANALTSPPKVCLSYSADVAWSSLLNEQCFQGCAVLSHGISEKLLQQSLRLLKNSGFDFGLFLQNIVNQALFLEQQLVYWYKPSKPVVPLICSSHLLVGCQQSCYKVAQLFEGLNCFLKNVIICKECTLSSSCKCKTFFALEISCIITRLQCDADT